MDAHQEVLVVVAGADSYPDAIDAWRRSAAVTELLPPRLALVVPAGSPPEVPGTRWYSGSVPTDVLLSLDLPERIFVAAWQDRLTAKVGRDDSLFRDWSGDQAPEADPDPE